MILVDTNILIDTFSVEHPWKEWSSQKLVELSDTDYLCINSIIFAEFSAFYSSFAEAHRQLPESLYERTEIPYEAAYLAGQAFKLYRQRGGPRLRTLPDFFIGAHAQVAHIPILTRDTEGYRTYFPDVKLIAPEST